MNYLMRIHLNLNGENEDDSEQTAKKSFNCDYVALFLLDIYSRFGICIRKI